MTRTFASLALCAIIFVTAAWAQAPDRPKQPQQPGDRPQMGQPQQPGAQQQTGQQQTGQQMGQAGQRQTGAAGQLQPPSAWYKAKDLIGKHLRDANNTELGEIDDLIMLPHDGAIPFAIMSGRRIDRAGEHIALPWSVLSFEPGAKDVTLNTTKDKLQAAQLAAFKSDQWPDFALATFVERVYREFGESPPAYMQQVRTAGQVEREGGQAAAGAHWFKISTLRDDEIRSADGTKIGDVDNVVIDLNNGHILFVTLAGRHVDRHDEYVAIPWGALHIEGSDDRTHLVLNMSKEQLKTAPAFKEDNWANITDTAFLKNVFAFYKVQPYWEGRTRQAGYTEPTKQRDTGDTGERGQQPGGGGQQPGGGGRQP